MCYVVVIIWIYDYVLGTPETYGSILAWDSIMPKLSDNYSAIKKQLTIHL